MVSNFERVKQELLFLEPAHHLALECASERGDLSEEDCQIVESGKYTLMIVASKYMSKIQAKVGKQGIQVGLHLNPNENKVVVGVISGVDFESDCEEIAKHFDENTINVIISSIHTNTQLGDTHRLGYGGKLDVYNFDNYQIYYRK